MNDLLLRALRCEPTERRPLWILRQAGRFLPEYRELRARASFEELCASPELAAQVTLMPIERFALDGAIIFADIMSPAAALGIDFRFDPGPVISNPVRSAADVRRLVVPDDEIAPEVHAAHRLVRKALAGRATQIGFAAAPLTLACYLVQGRGGGDFAPLRAFLAEDPRAFGELLDKLARLSARYLAQQAQAGAQVLQVFDSWAGLVSEPDWETHVRPPTERLLAELAATGCPRVYYAQGAPHLARRHGTHSSEALQVCWRTDLARLRAELGPAETSRKALQGNLDNAVLLAGPDTVQRQARALLARMPARGHVLNLGHGILPQTPLESVAALLEVVRSEPRAA